MQKTLSRQLLFFKATNKLIFPNKILPCVLFFLFDILEDSSSLNKGVVGCGEGVVYLTSPGVQLILAYSWFLNALRFNDLSTLVGNFVSSLHTIATVLTDFVGI